MRQGELVGNTPQPAFRSIYPTPSAGRKNKRGETVLTDDLENVFTNDKLVYCTKCGFPCKIDRDERHQILDDAGKGVSLVELSDTRTVKDYLTGGTLTYNLQDILVTAGCPCCGSFLYDQK